MSVWSVDRIAIGAHRSRYSAYRRIAAYSRYRSVSPRSPRCDAEPQSSGRLSNGGTRLVAICEIGCLPIVVVAATAHDVRARSRTERPFERVAGGVVQSVRADRIRVAADLVGP